MVNHLKHIHEVINKNRIGHIWKNVVSGGPKSWNKNDHKWRTTRGNLKFGIMGATK